MNGWTEAEIAEMEADDGRERLFPLWMRQATAETMREQNAAAERWTALIEEDLGERPRENWDE